MINNHELGFFFKKKNKEEESYDFDDANGRELMFLAMDLNNAHI